jgi:hypothetical protein
MRRRTSQVRRPYSIRTRRGPGGSGTGPMRDQLETCAQQVIGRGRGRGRGLEGFYVWEAHGCVHGLTM